MMLRTFLLFVPLFFVTVRSEVNLLLSSLDSMPVAQLRSFFQSPLALQLTTAAVTAYLSDDDDDGSPQVTLRSNFSTVDVALKSVSFLVENAFVDPIASAGEMGRSSSLLFASNVYTLSSPYCSRFG